MKKLTILFILASLYSCEKVRNKAGEKQIYQNWIPNWENDTMVGVSYGNPPDEVDTMYSALIGDTSLIYYKGEKYYVWTENVVLSSGVYIYQFEKDKNYYNDIVVSKVLFPNKLTDIVATGEYAMPGRYYEKSTNTWERQAQSISLYKRSLIPKWVAEGNYSTANKKFLK